jgi:hypothetical protein
METYHLKWLVFAADELPAPACGNKGDSQMPTENLDMGTPVAGADAD